MPQSHSELGVWRNYGKVNMVAVFAPTTRQEAWMKVEMTGLCWSTDTYLRMVCVTSPMQCLNSTVFTNPVLSKCVELQCEAAG